MALAVASVMIGNRYGSFWGAFIGILIGPLVVAQLLREFLGMKRSR